MENLEKTDFCHSCGRPCKDLFCNDKCLKAFLRKEQQIRTKSHGKRANYGVRGA